MTRLDIKLKRSSKRQRLMCLQMKERLNRELKGLKKLIKI
jgi:hypothetical protein